MEEISSSGTSFPTFTIRDIVPVEIWQHIFLLANELASDFPSPLHELSHSISDPYCTPNIIPDCSWAIPMCSKCAKSWTMFPRLPLVLSQVCADWRRLALHTPDLWNMIYADVDEEDLFNSNRLEHHPLLALFTLFLSRSGTLPLHVVLQSRHSTPPSGDPSQRSYVVRDLYRVLIPHHARWASLHLSLPLDAVLSEWEAQRDGSPFPRLPLLKSLKLHETSWRTTERTITQLESGLIAPFSSFAQRQVNDGSDAFNMDPFILASPNLTRLSLSTYPSTPTALIGKALSHLHLHIVPSETNAIMHLLTCVASTLQVLLLSGRGITRDDMLPPQAHYGLRSGPLVVERLHTLTLVDPAGREQLLSRLRLPSLQKLSLRGKAPNEAELQRVCVAIRESMEGDDSLDGLMGPGMSRTAFLCGLSPAWDFESLGLALSIRWQD